MFEKFLAAAWNRLAASNNKDGDASSGLDLGFLISDGEIQKKRAYLPQQKRAEHLAILGKTGQGKSYFLRHLSRQDIRAGQGFGFFDLHGDATPFLSQTVAAEDRLTRWELRH